MLNYCKIKKIAAEWEGAVRTYKLFSLTPALSTAADPALSWALQPRPQGPARTPRLRSGKSPRGCRQLNKHTKALRSVKGWGRLPAPGGTRAPLVPGAGASAGSSTRSSSSLTAAPSSQRTSTLRSLPILFPAAGQARRRLSNPVLAVEIPPTLL